MSIDQSKIQMSGVNSSLKLWLSGGGTITVPAQGPYGSITVSTPISHGYGSDLLLAQVVVDWPDYPYGPAPWHTPDGRLSTYYSINSTNLNIYINSIDTGGSGTGAYTMNYSYRLLIP